MNFPNQTKFSTKTLKLPSSGFRRWLSHLSISGKISCGYALAVGVALAGTMTGIIIGETYQLHSRELIEDALEETHLLHKLETKLLESKSLEQELFFLLDKPDLLKTQYTLFQQRIIQLEQVWSELKESYSKPEVEETDDEQKAFEEVRQEYEASVAIYLEQAKAIYQDTNKQSLTSSEIENIRATLLEFNSSTLALRMTKFIEKINAIVDVINQEVEDAEASLTKYAQLRLQIIFVSIIISVIMAVVTTKYLVNTLTRPIQTLTDIAKKVTEESNFELQAPVTTVDEVGYLATTINKLIARVRQLLLEQKENQEKLKNYNYTLEKKVQERTEELNDKNQFLKQTLLELQRTQSQIIQSEKMSSLGQLVAGVAHEINNPVSFIYGNLSHASEYTKDLLKLIEIYQENYPQPVSTVRAQIKKMDLEYVKEDLPQVINSMQVGAERITEIVQSLRNFSRTDESELKRVNIHEGIDSTLMILRNRLKAHGNNPEIKVIKEYGKLPLVNCYPGPLNQVFMNILGNAIDAIEEYNQRCTKEEIKQNPSYLKIITETIENDWVVIRLADSGGGVPENICSKLFDPFFTTKPIGKGTGLGLSISYQIVVEKHGGKIMCNSTPGKGTEFVIELPIKNSKNRYTS